MDDLDEVRTSLESSMDTKMNKMESKIDQLTELINLMMSKKKPTVVLSDDAEGSSEAALKAAANAQSTEDNPKNKRMILPPNLKMEKEYIIKFHHLYPLILKFLTIMLTTLVNHQR